MLDVHGVLRRPSIIKSQHLAGMYSTTTSAVTTGTTTTASAATTITATTTATMFNHATPC